MLQHATEKSLHLCNGPSHEPDLAQVAVVLQLPAFLLTGLPQVCQVRVIVLVLNQIITSLALFYPQRAFVLLDVHVVQTQHCSWKGEGSKLIQEKSKIN